MRKLQHGAGDALVVPVRSRDPTQQQCLCAANGGDHLKYNPLLSNAREADSKLKRVFFYARHEAFIGKGDGSHDTNVSDHERRMQMQMPKLRLTAKTKSKVKTDRARTLHGVKCLLL